MSDIKVKLPILQADVEVPTNHEVLVKPRAFVLSDASCHVGGGNGAVIPAWLDEAIANQLAAGTLTLTELVTGLDAVIRGIETGVNQQISSLQTTNTSLNNLITTNVSRIDTNTAAIVTELDTKVDNTQATTLFTNLLTSQFNTPESDANAWIVGQTATLANGVQANATSFLALTASYNGVSASITDLQTVTVDGSGYSLGASKLGTAPDGSIVGWEFLDGTGIQSQFKIHADYFSISNGTTGHTPFEIIGDVINFDGTVSINKLASSIHIGTFTNATIPSNPTFTFGGQVYTIKDGDTYLNSDDGIVYAYAGTVWVSTQGEAGLDGTNGIDGSRGAISAFAVYTGTPTDTQLTATINAISTPDGVINGDNVTYTVNTSGTKIAYYNGTAWVKDIALYIHGNAVIDGTLSATKLVATDAWINGSIQSSDFTTVGGSGFRLKANALDTFADPTMYGAYIRGGYIYGTTIESATMKIRDLTVLSDSDLATRAVISDTVITPVYTTNLVTWTFDMGRWDAAVTNNRLASTDAVINVSGVTTIGLLVDSVYESYSHSGYVFLWAHSDGNAFKNYYTINVNGASYTTPHSGDYPAVGTHYFSVGGFDFVAYKNNPFGGDDHVWYIAMAPTQSAPTSWSNTSEIKITLTSAETSTVYSVATEPYGFTLTGYNI